MSRAGEAIRTLFSKGNGEKTRTITADVANCKPDTANRLFNYRIERVADGALMVCGVIFAPGVAEEGKAAGAAIHSGCGGQFILSGSAKIAGAHDDHAVAIAIALAADQLGVEQCSRVGRDFCAVAKFGQRFGKARVGFAIRFDGGGDGFQVAQRLLLVATDCGLIPFDLE